MPTPFTYSSIGVSGYSGYSGYSGQVGASAASGYSGISGYSGTSGYSGVSGYSGAFAGTGTSGYIPRFTGASSLGNSLIQDNGSTLTVNASTLVQGVLSTLSTNGVNVFESAGISSVGLQFKTNSTNRFKIETPNASNDLAFYYGGTTEVGRFSSTGLAVTGTLSATTAYGSVAITSSTGTNGADVRFINTGGTYYVGVDSSTGGAFGATAYDMINFLPTGRGFSTVINGSGVVTRVSSTGLAVTGALSATGIISSTAGGEIPLRISGGGTGAQVLRVQTTGGDYFFGAERSAGNYFIVGSTGYDTIIRGPSGIAFSANNGNNMQMRLSSTGLAVTGALTTTGSVAIGTSSAAAKLHVVDTTSSVALLESSGAATTASAYTVLKANSGSVAGNYYRAILGQDESNNYNWGIGNFGCAKDVLAFYSGGLTERMRIDVAGNVGIGTTSPATKLDVSGHVAFGVGSTSGFNVILRDYTTGTARNWGIRDDGGVDRLRFSRGASDYWFWDVTKVNASDGVNVQSWRAFVGYEWVVNSTTLLTLNSNGLGVGTTSLASDTRLTVAAPSDYGPGITIKSNSSASNWVRMDLTNTNTAGGLLFIQDNGGQAYIRNEGTNSTISFMTAGGITRAQVSTTGLAVTGALSCTGALSKGSGSFRIEHPLPEKSATHQLVHSFIEGPQADLIYRGKVVLVDGKASVNIDAAATMTEGTFEVLCRDVQCFTTNETGWTAVRGKVTGNILTIEAKDADCADEISWMVIGERQDPHMMETDWTDDNGKVIVEPLKPAAL